MKRTIGEQRKKKQENTDSARENKGVRETSHLLK